MSQTERTRHVHDVIDFCTRIFVLYKSKLGGHNVKKQLFGISLSGLLSFTAGFSIKKNKKEKSFFILHSGFSIASLDICQP
jgi:hypothetical protein